VRVIHLTRLNGEAITVKPQAIAYVASVSNGGSRVYFCESRPGSDRRLTVQVRESREEVEQALATDA
jgi:hypothetical protein